MRILIVEDDPEVANTVGLAFSIRWPQASVKVAETGQSALDSLFKGPYDLVILDVNLPDQNGFAVLQAIRKTSRVPVIMLTVRAAESERVLGLEMGADDYIAKPFSPLEFLARASAVLRRAGSPVPDTDSKVLRAGELKLDPATAEVFVGDRLVKLSPTEFKILTILMENAGKVVKHTNLVRQIWGAGAWDADQSIIKLHIQHLRKKLGDNGENPKYILTVRGFGYKVGAQ